MKIKMKSKRAAVKRFKVTATKKFKYQQSHMRHILVGTSGDYKRDKMAPAYVHESDMKRVQQMLPYYKKM